jgi:hypothetical protein
MPNLDNFTKAKIEHLFAMDGGYVLDFSNASFAEFVKTAVGFDPYERYSDAGSKARTLRAIWDNEPVDIVAKLLLQMLEYWRTSNLTHGIVVSENDQQIYDELHETLSAMKEKTGLAPEAKRFLSLDFSSLDLRRLPAAVDTQEIINQRIIEISRCLAAEAPLAAILLVGSTLEGILFQVARGNERRFLSASGAPRDKRKNHVLPLSRWTLSNLIDVAGELHILSMDVQNFADHVRKYRNYIHPERQKREAFTPRMETARIAQQVLQAAIQDISNLK